ncbi:MAG: hypothetical protein H0T42_29590 [Deltaproteobacteria bacterium]|nr:hypothetical protein [Deltaproteobacteria bacterium]
MKRFLVDALSSALDLGIATPDDVLGHVTPDMLAQHLPRPLWARLITACLGASRVDSQLVVETLGVSNLCEHIPSTAIWSCLADIGQRSLGGEASTRAAAAPQAPAIVTRPAKNAPLSISGPPPPDPVKPAPAAPPPMMAGPSIPAPSHSDNGADDDRAGIARPRTATGSRFRSTSTNIGRLAATSNQRRPQAAAPSPPPPPEADPVTDRPTRTILPVRRGQTEVEVEEVESPNGDWRNALAVEDEQLVDWSASDETVTGEDPDARKR